MKCAVIGLGQFGSSLARALSVEGHEVLAIDSNEGTIDSVKDEVALAVNADATDRRVLEQLGVSDTDMGIVAIGEDFESSLVITAHLQHLKVKKIFCRVINPVHEHIIDLMHVTEKIRPEVIAAQQFAKKISIRKAIRHFALEDDFAIVELAAPDFLIGHTLAEAELRARFDVNLVSVETLEKAGTDEEHRKLIGVPTPAYRFNKGDNLIVFGKDENIRRLSRR